MFTSFFLHKIIVEKLINYGVQINRKRLFSTFYPNLSANDIRVSWKQFELVHLIWTYFVASFSLICSDATTFVRHSSAGLPRCDFVPKFVTSQTWLTQNVIILMSYYVPSDTWLTWDNLANLAIILGYYSHILYRSYFSNSSDELMFINNVSMKVGFSGTFVGHNIMTKRKLCCVHMAIKKHETIFF